MTTFNDLPDDVLWLIFQPLCIEEMSENYGSHYGLKVFEIPFPIPNHFNRTNFNSLATINKKCLNLFKKKCKKCMYGWLFIKGAITHNYKSNMEYEPVNKKRKIE
jgi:hypothetical protein